MRIPDEELTESTYQFDGAPGRDEGVPYFKILRRRKAIVLGALFLILGLVAAFTFLRESLYEADATLIRRETALETQILDTRAFVETDTQRDLVTMTDMITSERVASLVREELELSLEPEELLEQISARASADSNIITVTAGSTSPLLAADLANSFANTAIELRRQNTQQSIAQAREVLRAQLGAMSETERESVEGQRLEELLGGLSIIEEMQTGGYEVWQPADVPAEPVAPRPFRDLFAALVVGLVVGVSGAFLVDRFDDRLREADEFEREYGMPVLAKVPTVGGALLGRPRLEEFVGFRERDGELVESYRTLRTNLRFLQAQSEFRTILIASGRPGEGKSAAASNLALSLAMAGSFVCVVDADLRRPTLHQYLALKNHRGVSDILVGDVTVDTALQSVDLSRYLPSQHGRTNTQKRFPAGMVVGIPAGTPPPNPTELLTSLSMRDLVGDLQGTGDYVIIDSPPLLTFADALSLSPLVDAVIVVGRRGKSTAEEAHQIRSMLSRSGMRVLGIVMVGEVEQVDHYAYFQTSTEF